MTSSWLLPCQMLPAPHCHRKKLVGDRDPSTGVKGNSVRGMRDPAKADTAATRVSRKGHAGCGMLWKARSRV